MDILSIFGVNFSDTVTSFVQKILGLLERFILGAFGIPAGS